ncbi:uncharacterized protein METZ01_LOCUS296288, partial [marine metagenome]
MVSWCIDRLPVQKTLQDYRGCYPVSRSFSLLA